ncbi:hypothetical protein [Pseudomonas sp. RIT288]|jgi:hypothetical protein|uniref:hypothetical protein n=1 Tax=Pseudomonas sp. RIT288 TaxID=1470589 RepID=UPI000452B187|nr:hypothetical protein [Pseudomonas sp. RIT288]EZP32702.1 hypothetical protein BW33_01565 [Pseudomonas sp. RIT288]
MRNLQLFAPEAFPTAHSEVRAYTIAAFRVAQASDQLSLIAMSKPLLEFLVKKRALGYWLSRGRLIQEVHGYRLTERRLVDCQSALALQLPTHNTTASQVAFWVNEFCSNAELKRTATFEI